jgi:NhaP-type Na+/H+ or K+/H+ antiporter
LPWEGWLELGWGGLLLVVAVLLLRRLPAVLALRPLLGVVRGRAKDVLFLGWFGPIGAAALSESPPSGPVFEQHPALTTL